MTGATREDPAEASSVASVLGNLSSEYRRQVVAYFLATEERIASLSDVAEYVHVESDDGGTALDEVKIQLHHAALPKLAAAGVLDYDARSRTVRYRGEPTLEDVQEYLSVTGD